MSLTLDDEKAIKSLREAVSLKESLARLRNNADFKKVVTNHLFKDYLAELMIVNADEQVLPQVRDDALESAKAIAKFRHTLEIIHAFGEQAARRLETYVEDVERLDAILSGDDN